MEQSPYDRRDARQRCGWFIAFAFIASWTIWAGLWAPGVHRLAYVPTAIVVLGMWGAALAGKLTLTLFRTRRPLATPVPDDDPSASGEFVLATGVALACCAAAVGVSFGLGGSNWQWRWMPSGFPLVVGGIFGQMTIEMYDTLNWIGLVAQTAIAELTLWLAILVVLAGAEIGWRGVLLPDVAGTGWRPWQASILVGAIWGIWLSPLVWRGDLTGYYPGDPVRGTGAVIANGTAWGALLGWLYFRHLRLGPVVVAAGWAGWMAWVLPNISSPYDILVHADPRSLSCTAIVAAVAAVLWRLAPPRATLDRPIKPFD